MNQSTVEYLFCVLENFSAIPQEEKKKISDRIKVFNLKKDEYFVKQGSRPERLALISSGIFRVFCLSESGDEKTLAFRTKGQFLAAFTPFLEERVSWYSIQALTEAELVSIPIMDYISLSSGHSCWDKVIKSILLQLFIEKEDRERSFLIEDASTRYGKFRKTFPELENLIPQFHIASYLGISPVSLSRIRKKIKNDLN